MEMINLGHSMGDIKYPEAAPSEPSEKTMYYPSVYIDDVKGLEDFPDEGTAVIKFKLTKKTKDLKTGKMCISMDILKIKPDVTESPKPDAGDVLDALKEKLELE